MYWYQWELSSFWKSAKLDYPLQNYLPLNCKIVKISACEHDRLHFFHLICMKLTQCIDIKESLVPFENRQNLIIRCIIISPWNCKIVKISACEHDRSFMLYPIFMKLIQCIDVNERLVVYANQQNRIICCRIIFLWIAKKELPVNFTHFVVC